VANKNLIIALVFAAVFGTALIWLAIYYIHRYIHLRCLELDHWFHLLTPPQWRSPCRHCEGTGRDVADKTRSRSSRRRERSRSRGRYERSGIRGGGHGRVQRMIETDTEWDAFRPEMMKRPRQPLPAVSQVMQSPRGQEQYNPWQAWQVQNVGQQMYPQVFQQYPQYPQAFPQNTHSQPYQQDARLTSPFMMPAPKTVGSSASSAPAYYKPPRKAASERPEPPRKPAQEKEHRVHREDFIHIVDEYPPLVKEAITKAAPPPPSSPTQSDSSTSTESAEEVVRSSIPQAPPRFVNPTFPYPQYAPLTDHARHVPTSYPRRWNGTGGRPTEQFRYAPFYMRPPCWMSRGVNAGRRRYSSSNAPPRSNAPVG
jgi:hypothetical protein